MIALTAPLLPAYHTKFGLDLGAEIEETLTNTPWPLALGLEVRENVFFGGVLEG